VVTASPDTLTIERRLTVAQAKRRARARDAARALAAEGGYAAVTMHDVARRSGIARATVYRYFASKDHLLAEVALEWGRELVADLAAAPPRGATLAARVASVFTRVIEAAAREPELTDAVVAAAISADPEAIRAQTRLAELVRGYLQAAIGDRAVDRRNDREMVMSHLFFSSLLNLTRGRLDAGEAAALFRTAAALLYPEGRKR